MFSERISYIQPSTNINILPFPHPIFRVDASLSPYAGCMSNCVFCPFGAAGKTGIKTNFLHQLKEKLSEEKRRLHLGLGSTCEPYCAEEQKFNLTHNTLEIVMEHSQPLQIFTKSDLIMKDIDLLREYSRRGLLAVSISIFSVDDETAGIFEPDILNTNTRLTLLRELRSMDIFAGITLAPIIPYVSDDYNHLDELFRKVKKADAEYILPMVFAMTTPVVRRRLSAVLFEKYPRIQHRIDSLYGSDGLPSINYTQRINDLLKDLSSKHEIPIHLPTQSGVLENVGIRQKLLQ